MNAKIYYAVYKEAILTVDDKFLITEEIPDDEANALSQELYKKVLAQLPEESGHTEIFSINQINGDTFWEF